MPVKKRTISREAVGCMGVFGGETDLRLVDQTFNSFILFW
jgi:hypothetical protein